MATATPPTWTLGDRLRKARDSAGFTQTELANYLGLARNTVANYETDHREPSARTVADWAVICDVPVEWLLTQDPITARYSWDPQPATPRRRPWPTLAAA
jgi:transcriptional regulator with XRE-family HTH domain